MTFGLVGYSTVITFLLHIIYRMNFECILLYSYPKESNYAFHFLFRFFFILDKSRKHCFYGMLVTVVLNSLDAPTYQADIPNGKIRSRLVFFILTRLILVYLFSLPHTKQFSWVLARNGFRYTYIKSYVKFEKSCFLCFIISIVQPASIIFRIWYMNKCFVFRIHQYAI